MDMLSYQNRFLNKIDSTAKLIVLVFFVITVLSFDRYEISGLIPFVFFPVYLIASANIPYLYLLKKVLIVSPFALMVGIFNPFFDKSIMLCIGGIEISGGWISFLSIMIRFALTVSTALAVIACTGFNNICYALNRIGVPNIFTVQLLFLYRYIFILAEESARMVRARNFRSFDGKGKGVRSYGPMIGHLLLRTIKRSERIYLAMKCRGFDGNIRIIKKSGFGLKELFFTLTWIILFVIFRFVDVPQVSGNFITGLFR